MTGKDAHFEAHCETGKLLVGSQSDRQHDSFNFKASVCLFDNSRTLTNSCGLKHECNNAEEVDVGIVNGELHKDCLSVHIKPGVVIKVPKDSTRRKTWLNYMINTLINTLKQTNKKILP